MRSAILPALIVLFVLEARPSNDFSLTVDNIMRGPALVGYEPTGVRWSHDGSRILFQWKQSTDKEIAPMDTYTVNSDGSGLRKLSAEEVRLLPPAFGETTPAAGGISKDRRLVVYSNAGDLFTLDNDTGKITQLTKTTDAETDPVLDRRRGGGKRPEDCALSHPSLGRHRLQWRVPRPHARHHDPDGQGSAVQVGIRCAASRSVSRAVSVRLSRRHAPTVVGRDRAAVQGRFRTLAGRSADHRAGARRRRVLHRAARVPQEPARALRQPRHRAGGR